MKTDYKLPDTSDFTAYNLKANIDKFRDELPLQIELQVIVAKLTREKYLALVKEGFGTDQALYLCK